MLVIPLERLAFIIAKAREFDAEVPVEPDAATGSDPPDDDERQVLLDTPDNPTEEEVRDAIDGLGPPERQELLALMWLGRGDYDAESWPEALRPGGRGDHCECHRLSGRHAASRRLPRRRSRRPRFVARGFRERLIPPFFAE